MNIFIEAINPKPDAEIESMEISEWRWRPARTILAIANQRIFEKTGILLIPYQDIPYLNFNYGYEIKNPEACSQIGENMLGLSQSMDVLTDYGMSVEIQNGQYIYSYPLVSCTSSLELKKGETMVDDKNDYKEEDLRSCHWIPEDSLISIAKFIKDSGGIRMP